MGNIELKDVVCCFRSDDNGRTEELVHIALSVDEAKKYISEQAMATLKEVGISKTKMDVFEDGVSIMHYCDLGNRLYDRSVSFAFKEDYAKLLVGG